MFLHLFPSLSSPNQLQEEDLVVPSKVREGLLGRLDHFRQGDHLHLTDGWEIQLYPLVMTNIAIENGHL